MGSEMANDMQTWRRSNGYWIRHIVGPGAYTFWQSTGLTDRRAAKALARSQDPTMVFLNEVLADRVGEWERRELVKNIFEEGPSRLAIIPTVGEAESLLSENSVDDAWGGNRIHYCINLLAALTGLSLGEIQGLQFQYVKLEDEPYIDIVNRWRRGGVLDVPLGGRPRRVAIPDFVAAQLQWVMTNAEFNSPEALVFQGDSEMRKRHGLSRRCGVFPICHSWIERRLHGALAKIGVNSKARGIEFDSWRYFSHRRGLLHAALKKRLAA